MSRCTRSPVRRLRRTSEQASPRCGAVHRPVPASRAVPRLHRSPVRRDGRAARRAHRLSPATPRDRGVRHARRLAASVGHAEGARAARGPTPELPGRGARRACPGQSAGRPRLHRGPRPGRAARADLSARAFDRAAAAIGMPGLHPHELRHTAASLAIASGADVKVVQRDARPHVRGDDARPVRAPVRRPFGRRRRRVSTSPRGQLMCTRCVPDPKSWILTRSAGEATAQ